MKIVVAMDSFKGTMTARQACAYVRTGILRALPDAEVVLMPMADGGEGTAAALMTTRNGVWIPCNTMGPLPDQHVEAGFAWFENDRTALVEMAIASGLPLVPEHRRNPLHTTTYGTGQCMQAAITHGAEKIFLAVGGSATTDGGVGAATALGWQFLDEAGAPVPLGGEHVAKIARVIPADPPVRVSVEVLCDVTNPLTGPHGAAAVYGPQKGATPAMVEILDTALRHWAHIARTRLGREIDAVPGAGAAGGLAAGMLACTPAKLVPGIDTVMAASGLAAALVDADWVISGEGRFDQQSLHGKVVSGILRLATSGNARVGVIAGSVQVDPSACQREGLAFALATAPADTPFEIAIQSAREDLIRTAEECARSTLFRI